MIQRSCFYYLPAQVSIYVEKDSLAHTALANDTALKAKNPVFKSLTQPARITAQAADDISLFAAVSQDVSFNTAEKYGFPQVEGHVWGIATAEAPTGARPHHITAFDALVAAHAEKYGWEDTAGEQLAIDADGNITRVFNRLARLWCRRRS